MFVPLGKARAPETTHKNRMWHELVPLKGWGSPQIVKHTHILLMCYCYRAARVCASEDSPWDLQTQDRKQARKQARQPI